MKLRAATLYSFLGDQLKREELQGQVACSLPDILFQTEQL